MKKRRNLFCVILVIVMLLVCNGCKATNEKNDNLDKDNQTENIEETKDIIVNKASDFERMVKNSTDEKQHFVLKEDITLGMGTISFNGSDISIDGGDERVSITMSSSGGLNFKGVSHPEQVKSGTSITIKNVDFVNDKTDGNDRDSRYVYAYADNVIYENCTFKGGVIVFGKAQFINCLFSETDELRYCVFIDNEHGRREEGMSVEIRGCTFEGNNTAYGLVKVADDSDVGAKLMISNCQFKNISNKAAVYVNGHTDVYTDGVNTYENCVIGAILAKGDNCTLNGEAMSADTSYEE